MSPSTYNTPKTVIITGGATGLGYAVAEQFLQQGDKVVLNGRTETKLTQAAQQLGETDRVAIVVADITQSKSADTIVNAAVDRFGGVDVLVNNAGVFEMKPFTDYTVNELDTYLGYLRGTFVITQAAVRQMRRQGRGGAIINISTILAMNGVAGVPSSAPIAAKGGISALTKNLSMELAVDRIRINAVAPGIVPTPLYGELSDADHEALHAMQPLGHYGTPRDVADAVLYLAKAEWVTGVILPVDGGVDAGGDGASRVATKEGALSAV